MASNSPPDSRRGIEAFRSRDFRRYQLARVMAILGAEAQSVAVAWQIYSITHRAIDLGYTGLALFLPGLLFLLPAGHVADRFDRRHVILICYSLQMVCSAALVYLAIRGSQNILPIFAVLFVIGTGRAFSGPAASALIPHLVPEEHFVNAVTWGGAIFQLANITGPALGGLLFT
jgi:MFS family permease